MLELTNLHLHRVFLRREAVAAGYDDDDLARAVRAGELTRVRHGAYTDARLWAASDPYDRHRLRCHAVLESHDEGLVLSHTSAAVVHGLAVWPADLERVHLTRLDGKTTRVCHDVVYHRGNLPENHLVELDEGGRSTSAARAAVEHASISTIESGLVTVDSYLHLHRQTDLTSIERIQEHRAYWPGNRRLQITLRLARPGAESVGESRMRFLFWEFHLPEPELQYTVCNPSGRLIGYGDFGWPDRRLLGEFDGKVKYELHLRDGETSADVVVREKHREDLMREYSGFSMIRFVWSDLYQRERTAERLKRALRLS